ncbi:MAG TPA: type I methionyl aminopeptidase [Rhodospirillales bacterium]|nr:type I methionyl aminopeptidase [Rhodospirillales bacterium]
MNDISAHYTPVQERNITIHKPGDFEGMRKAGRLAAESLDFIAPYVKPGTATEKLDSLIHDFIVTHGASPAPLNYRGFPKSICTSINHVVCHGIPGEKKLQNGDIVNIDVTTILGEWHGDTSRMFYVGDVGVKARRLVDVTFQALWRGIEAIKPGATVGDIGCAIQSFVEANRFSVVRDFCGHGLGRVFHEPPNVMHFGEAGKGVVLLEGMFFTIEPMINAGRFDVKVLKDGWTAVTKDRSLSAQFEHAIGVTQDGYEVFTLSPAGLHQPPYDV